MGCQTFASYVTFQQNGKLDQCVRLLRLCSAAVQILFELVRLSQVDPPCGPISGNTIKEVIESTGLLAK